MQTPNLLIIGAQKGGTSWLHSALDRSKYFSGSHPKELNFWNRPNSMDFDTYRSNFRSRGRNVQYWYESTPTYFQTSVGQVDVAKNIRNGLGDIPLLLMLRDPTDRYLSAYAHHMIMGRFPQQAEITAVTDTFKMLSLGCYGSIFEHFTKQFSNIHIHLFDDLKQGNLRLINSVMEQLDVPGDLKARDVTPKSTVRKLTNSILGWDNTITPKLSGDARKKLNDYYRDDVAHLATLIDRDLSHWLK